MYEIVRYVSYKGIKNESRVFSDEFELMDKEEKYSFVAGKIFNKKINIWIGCNFNKGWSVYRNT
jgi:hypothetical protein